MRFDYDFIILIESHEEAQQSLDRKLPDEERAPGLKKFFGMHSSSGLALGLLAVSST
jgi:hypothetical protein